MSLYHSKIKNTNIGLESPRKGTILKSSEEKLVKIKAIIVVEKKGHKAIVIGNKGETLKKIASPARLELQKHLMKKVFLDLKINDIPATSVAAIRSLKDLNQ